MNKNAEHFELLYSINSNISLKKELTSINKKDNCKSNIEFYGDKFEINYIKINNKINPYIYDEIYEFLNSIDNCKIEIEAKCK